MNLVKQDETVNILIVGGQEGQWHGFQEILTRALPWRDIALSFSGSASEALDILRPGFSTFNLVLVEDSIVDMNGLEFCRIIQSRDLPIPLVIMLTEENNISVEQRLIEVLEAGVHDYIIKDHQREYIHHLPLVIRKVVLNFKNCVFRKRVQASLQEYREKFFKAFVMSPNGIVISTYNEGRMIEVNEAIVKQSGYSREELLGKTSVQLGLIKTGDREIIKKQLDEHGSYTNLEMRLYNRFGEERVCLLSGHAITVGGEKCVIHTANDITLLKKMQEELLNSRNLESIGILAGGIARDFNDYLTSIMGNISIAKMSLHDTGKIHRSLSRAEEISLKAADLASKLLTFSEGGEPFKKKNCITEILRNTIDIHFRDSNVTFNYHKGTDLWPVFADETQLTQIFYNILLNAVQAMPVQEGSGEITIKTENIPILQGNEFSLEKGNYIKLSVEDNGLGISAENMNKIFDPFFTTKYIHNQQALGLGLSTCLSIIKKHKGAIKVDSTEGKGTTVTMYIPAYREDSVSHD